MELMWEYLEKSLNNKEINEKEFRQIEKNINEFGNYILSAGVEYIDVDENIINDYSEILKKKYKYLTMHKKLVTINSFYEYLLREKKIEISPIKIFNKLDEKEKVNYINRDDYEKVVDVFDENNKVEKKDKLIIQLLYETNLKLTDVLKLKKIDFLKYDYRAILIIHKGKMTPKSISQELGDEIKDYSKNDFSNELFLEVKSGQFRERLIEYGIKSGLNYILTPLILRNSKSINEQLELKKNEIDYFKKIKEVYMSIGIGDN